MLSAMNMGGFLQVALLLEAGPFLTLLPELRGEIRVQAVRRRYGFVAAITREWSGCHATGS